MAALIPLAASAGSSLMGAQSERAAGEIEQMEAETFAQQEEMSVVQREADRKFNLARAMASQTASASARGISAFEGSPLSILKADIEAEEKDTQRDQFMTRLTAMSTRARGKISESAAKSRASMGLLSDFSQIAQRTPSFGSSGSQTPVYKGTVSQSGGSGQATVGL